MVELKRDVPLVVIVIGLGVATVGADVVSPERAFGLAVGGSVVSWGTLYAMWLFFDDRIWGRMLSDERMQRITQRACSVAWLLMLGVSSSLMLSLDHYDGTVSAPHALLGVQAVGLVAFVGAMEYNRRHI
ncbi:hypothetical protein [Halostella litorea]|uniref:hypothetical protein n=1 Tax=Halostella litorea TaxID=2528831 RepID=UPI001092EE3E|nr:hypothetical protein [Halostella litorea]